MARKTKVILLDSVGRLGSLGDEVSVNAGYARNWLFPQKQAVPVTDEMRSEFEKQRKDLQKQQDARLVAAREQASQLTGFSLSMSVPAGPSGRMYGSVRAQELSDALSQSGVSVRKSEILLTNAIRELGEHAFIVQLHPQVRVDMSVNLHSSGTESVELLEKALAEDDEEEQGEKKRAEEKRDEKKRAEVKQDEEGDAEQPEADPSA